MRKRDWIDWSFVGIVVLGVVSLAIYCAYVESKDCAAKGGKMVKTGSPIYVKSGSVFIPIDQYQCNK